MTRKSRTHYYPKAQEDTRPDETNNMRKMHRDGNDQIPVPPSQDETIQAIKELVFGVVVRSTCTVPFRAPFSGAYADRQLGSP